MRKWSAMQSFQSFHFKYFVKIRASGFNLTKINSFKVMQLAKFLHKKTIYEISRSFFEIKLRINPLPHSKHTMECAPRVQNAYLTSPAMPIFVDLQIIYFFSCVLDVYGRGWRSSCTFLQQRFRDSL